MAYGDYAALLPAETLYQAPGAYQEAARAEATKRATYLSMMDQFYEQLTESRRQFDVTTKLEGQRIGIERERVGIERDRTQIQRDYLALAREQQESEEAYRTRELDIRHELGTGELGIRRGELRLGREQMELAEEQQEAQLEAQEQAMGFLESYYSGRETTAGGLLGSFVSEPTYIPGVTREQAGIPGEGEYYAAPGSDYAKEYWAEQGKYY